MDFLNELMNIFYPEKCMVCGQIGRFGEFFICGKCDELAGRIPPPHCLKCGKHVDEGSELCPDCRKLNLATDRGGALWEYDGGFTRTVLNLKFNKRIENAGPIGALCAKSIKQMGLDADINIIIPVPLNKSKKRSRGFNQSELIAKSIAKRLGLAVETEALIRIKNTVPQMSLSREQRAENIKGSMRVRNSGMVNGKEILLIDDIFTTGSTVNECARELKKAGAKTVNSFCVCV